MEEFTENQIRDYVCGWLMVGGNQDIAAVKAALRNALAMLEDREDGIEAYVEGGKDDGSGVPSEVRKYINECLEDGGKVFMFEPCRYEKAFFIEHSNGDVTICSWVGGHNEVHYSNIDNNVRNRLAKDLEAK